MEADKYQKDQDLQPSKDSSGSSTEPYITDDEDDSTYQNTSNLDSSNCCYQRRGRIAPKRTSKWSKKGHSRTKSEGSALFQKASCLLDNEAYRQGAITDNLTNEEMLSNCQISRRRVQSTCRDRDLSPSEVFRHYITQEKEQMDIMIGRIVHNVEDMAEVAALKVGYNIYRVNQGSIFLFKSLTLRAIQNRTRLFYLLQSSEVVKNIVHNVHEKAEAAAQKSSEIVHSAIEKSSLIADVAAQKSSKIVHSAIEKSSEIADHLWKVCHFEKLPAWQKDNEHLLYGHRPELASAAECFKSIFRYIHI